MEYWQGEKELKRKKERKTAKGKKENIYFTLEFKKACLEHRSNKCRYDTELLII
jgi:hypothetical protein